MANPNLFVWAPGGILAAAVGGVLLLFLLVWLSRLIHGPREGGSFPRPPELSFDMLLERSKVSLPASDRAALLDRVRSGQKIEAIKILRERTPLGLKEAKDAIEALEAEGAVTGRMTPSNSPAPLDPESLRRRVLDLVRDGQKIGAIKLYRDHTGAGLKEAKDAVEGMANEIDRV